MELNAFQKRLLTQVLNYYKENTKDLPECFRDDEEVDKLLKIFKDEVVSCQINLPR